MLKIGDMAPEFSLPDQNNHMVNSSDFLGKKSIVLFFYPKDDTPGCTAESCSFRDRSPEFSQSNAEILGISQDDATSHKNFIGKYNLPYPLLTDSKGIVASKYGVAKTLGLIAQRATFVIDPKGIIRMAYSSHINIQRHTDDALAAAKKIQNATLSEILA